jgi:anti-sigma regulatory factor (Ser/Thr protein kinase)
VATGDLVVKAAYRPELKAAAAARSFVRKVLRSWQRAGLWAGDDVLVDDAVLLTSELVTNAVLHAGTPVQLTCRCAADAIEISVLDFLPAQRIADDAPGAAAAAERTSGRGLQLPAKLASAWGVTYAADTKSVWFRMGMPARRAPGAAVPAPAPPRTELPVPAAAGEPLTASAEREDIAVLAPDLALALGSSAGAGDWQLFSRSEPDPSRR